ncbi:dihydroxyacetone phosphate acyltransferase-like [Styela clava]
MDLLYLPSEDLKEHGYSNLLKEVQQLGWFGPITFSKGIYYPEKYKHKIDRTPQDIWKGVLDADRVQWIASNIAREEEKDKGEILKDASKILQEMAYKEHLNLVRFFGFSMYHVMNTIYQEGIYYNTDTLEALKKAIREHPVILMPSHRCYMDFLVVSVLSVHLGLPLPAIASGMDFMTMKGVGFLLRSSGAFFMRRSFGTDRLYWALFTEYVHSLIINGDRTIEFFIEGTRSRSGKSLNPKLGLFSVVAEPYLKAQIYDIMIVPVSISYDRILEESLYAYELLGVPKPKESTSGLFKATGVLQQNYGSLHVHFSEPISIRKECCHMDRAIHSCYPRYMLRLTSAEQSYLNDLAFKVIQIQQKNMVISVWSLIATVLIHSLGGLKFIDLIKQIQWLLDLLRRCNVKVRVQSGNLEDVVKHVLFQYNHLVKVDSKNAEEATVRIKQDEKPISTRSSKKLVILQPVVRDRAAIHIIVASYRNQLIHVFVKPALVAIDLQIKHGLLECDTEQFDIHFADVSNEFQFMREMFYKEFIFAPNQLNTDYKEGLNFLCHSGALEKNGSVLRYHSRGKNVITFLMDLLRPFLTCYKLICDYASQFHHARELKEFCNLVQLWMAESIEDNQVMLEILSKDMINNGVHGIEKTGALRISKKAGEHIVHVRRRKAQSISKKLECLREGKHDVQSLQTISSQSKL